MHTLRENSTWLLDTEIDALHLSYAGKDQIANGCCIGYVHVLF